MTNKDYIIELQHMVTGKPTPWRIARFPSPAATRLIEKREANLAAQNAMKVEGKFDLEKLSESDRTRFVELTKQFDTYSFKLLAMILDPEFELPADTSKDEFLAECVGVYEVFDTVIGFFLSICSNSVKSQADRVLLQPAELSRMVTIRKPQES